MLRVIIMKNIHWMVGCLMLTNCAVVDLSDFRYLNDDNLDFHRLLIIGAEQDVEISLPGSLAVEMPDTVFVKHQGLELPYVKVLDIPYEWLWGGPIHKDKGLYVLELGFTNDTNRKLLSESVEDRIQSFKAHYEGFEEGPWRAYVLENFVAKGYRSSQGGQWVMKNLPTVMPYHEIFHLPISDQRQLIVWFWYNEDWVKDHPEWYERRKALSRRILDSVKLSGPK